MTADSLSIATQLKAFVPWLSNDVTAYLTHVLMGLPIVVAILGLEFVSALLARVSPLVSAVTNRVAGFSFILNPLLAAILGALFGDSSLGLVAGGVWSAANATSKRLVGKSIGTAVEEMRVRGAAVWLVVLASALLFSSADAAPRREVVVEDVPGIAYLAVQEAGAEKVSLWSPRNFTVSAGAFHDWSRMCIGVQPGWRLPQRHITLRGRIAWKADDWSRPRQREVGVWLTF